MSNTLYLCEKPSQARALAKALGATTQENGAIVGNGVIVTYGYGHLQNLAAPDDYIGNAEWRLEDLPILPGEWQWKVSRDHLDQFENIGRWLSATRSVVIATDPDEEGEVIGRQILKAHGYTGATQRLWASALDPDSLCVALDNLLPLSATEPYYRAGMMRRLLDWLFGMNLSRAFSIRFGRTAHIGRVKTRLLSELAMREKEVESFSPLYFDTASITIDGHNFDWAQTSLIAPSFQELGVCLSSIVESIDLSPPLPFSLSELLIHASQTAGISLARGYAAAQNLYEAGAISYPRTSSTALPSAAAPGFAVHHAIVNTRNEFPNWAGEDERAIFNMIHLNGVLQNLGSARISRCTTVFDFGGALFTNVTERTCEKDAGWLLCMPERLDTLTAARVGSFRPGQKVHAQPVLSTVEISPPRRYTEASILRMMVDNGIGTEATRVEAITSLKRDKVSLYDEDEFRLTIAGRELNDLLPSGLSQEMNRRVQESIDQIKRNGGNGGSQLLSSTKWLARIIRGQSQSDVVELAP